MPQKRFIMALIVIENEILAELDIKNIISNFGNIKSKKLNIYQSFSNTFMKVLLCKTIYHLKYQNYRLDLRKFN